MKIFVEIIEANGGMTVSVEEIETLFADIMTGYQEYAAQNGYTDPEMFDEYLMEYLQTSQAQAIIQQWIDTVFSSKYGDSNYFRTACKTGPQIWLTAIRHMLCRTDFLIRIRWKNILLTIWVTDAAQTLLSDGIASMVNTDGIQSQISGALQGYVQEAMGAYASAIGQTLETQIHRQ